jgi:hypothetical protein
MPIYRRWVVANAWSECLGLGTTLVVAGAVAPWLERTERLPGAIAGALAAILLGMALEGAVVGWAQEGVIRRSLLRLRPGAWVGATVVGAGLAWALGMIPSTIMTLLSVSDGAESSSPSATAQYVFAALLGAVAGPVLAAAQWTTLRRHVDRAGSWLWANALAWSVGMPLVFAGMDIVPWTGPAPARWLAIYAVCAFVGASVGAIHGLILQRLLNTARGEHVKNSAAA